MNTAQLLEIPAKWPHLRSDAAATCYHVSPPMRGFSYVIGVESGRGIVDIVGASERGVPLRGAANDALMWIHNHWPDGDPSTVEDEFAKLGYKVSR